MGVELPKLVRRCSGGRRMLNRLFLVFGCMVVWLVGCQVDRIAKPLIFHNTKFPIGRWNERPSDCVEARFTNARDEVLHGWYFPFAGTPKAVILYCHGNGENVSNHVRTAGELRDRLQSSVFVFDYAGYGKSEGEPSTAGILEDGRAARRWLAQQSGVKESDIVVFGQSLGGSVAVDLAAKDGARGLIVESSFTSLGDMGRQFLPFLPVNWLLKENLASVKKIGNFRGPVFISHGKADSVIPFEQGERLHKAANEPKTFYIPKPGLDHHSAPRSAEHFEKLQEFIDGLSVKRQ